MEKLILIVEDSPETLELLRRIVENSGYKSIVANDGEKGYKYAIEHKPDFIILDRLLPFMDGLTICKRLKEKPETRDIPIMFLSILDTERDIIEGLRCGADDYMKKPFSPDELLARMEAIMRRYKKSFDNMNNSNNLDKSKEVS